MKTIASSIFRHVLSLALTTLFCSVTAVNATPQFHRSEIIFATGETAIGKHAQHGNQIVVIDSGVAEQHKLLLGIDRRIEVIQLRPGQNGLSQLADALQGRSRITAIHLISHGEPGSLLLGGVAIDRDRLDDHSRDLAIIGMALEESGDILLYGCNVAKNENGKTFIRRLSAMTGADVAASDDATGSITAGGNWLLESSYGEIETDIVVNPIQGDDYGHLLALPVIGGTASAQGVNDNATIAPFSGVTITDTDGHNVTTTVTLDNNIKGIFTGASLIASGFTGTGPYTLTATTPANAQTAIRQLVYDPADNRVAPGSTETTTFTINVDDGTLNGTDNTTTVVTTSINDNPGFSGTPSITGTASVGGTLNAANTGTTDPDTGDGITLSYQWMSNGANITGATASSYILTSGEAHTTITLNVTANDNFGGTTGAFTTAGVAVSNSAPVNSGLPAISGGASVGGTLNTTNGTWTDADNDGLSYAYQWRADGIDIAGATASGYTLTSSEAHTTITVVVTASDGNGGSTPATSAGTAVANTAPVNTLLPAISGTAAVGNTLTASNGTWSDADNDGLSYAYQWRADGIDITGATASGHTLTSSEAHTTITVAVTASDGNGGSTPATSAGTAVANTAPVNTLLPAISGTAAVGNTLTASNGTWSDADTDGLSYAYQWRADGIDIAGATASGHTLTSSEAHTTITVAVTASDGNGGSTPATSAGTAVANTAPVNTLVPAISGTAAIGNTLTATNGTWTDADNDGLSYTYQWRADGVDIAGATNSSFTLTASQAGTLLSIVVTADDGFGGSGTASSTGIAGNSPPVISGSPLTSVVGHTAYSFTPVASDSDNEPYSFSIVNMPAWAQFDTATGQLYGTPTNSDVGTTNGIVITVSDGLNSNSLSAFNLTVTENPDIDGDGIPNDWELANGLDPNDPNDATTDLDGDGISNLEEYLATGDPLSDDNPPVLELPSDVTVNAVGLFTPVDIGEATAYDDLDGTLAPSSDALPYYAPGSHHVTWSVSDTAGNTASGVQTINVIPLVSFSMDQSTSEGADVSFRVILNGEAVAYPVSVPYVVAGSASTDGSDHDLTQGTAMINDGLETTVSFNTVDDGPGEGTEQIVITMDEPTNAVAGPQSSHTVSLIEGNIAPRISLSAMQSGQQIRTVEIGEDLVTVTSALIDPNRDDNHSYDWSATDARLSDIDIAADTYTFSSNELVPGLYTLHLSVDDGSETGEASLALAVIESPPSLSDSLDSDGDGVDDANEGIADEDNDGVPNYLDAIPNTNILQEQSALSTSYLIESEPSVSLSLGSVALQTQDGKANIDTSDLENAGLPSDDEYDFSSGLFDFDIKEIPIAGQSVQIVISQFAAIPANAVYRKLMPTGWIDFVIDENNTVASAAGDAGFCPPPGDSNYTAGLTEGHWCVQLTIEDGGPNDADGSVNHAIDDPGGVAQKLSSGQGATSSGGGGNNDILFLLSLITLLLRRKNIRHLG